MNIFILEDSVYRMKMFGNLLAGHHVVFSCSVDNAKTILKENQFDVLFLDHDLDQCIFVPSDKPNTGYQLAQWIRYDTDMRFSHIIVHSMNPLGAQKIAEKARKFSSNVKVIPFPFLFMCKNLLK